MTTRADHQPALILVASLAVAIGATATGLAVTGGFAALATALTTGYGWQLSLKLMGVLGGGLALTYIVASIVSTRKQPALPRADFVVRPIVIEEDQQPPPPEEAPLEVALNKLDRMVGLAPVKEEIKTLMARLQLEKRRRDQGLPVTALSMHMVFTGPPGVGKTEVARLVGQIYKGLDVLRKGHVVQVDREGLVAGYVGQTAIKTAEKCREALDGVLFIDEAYSLVENTGGQNFGKEAIEILLKFMEDYRDRIIVIVAGYPKQMDEFKDANPGLKGRFSKTIDFPRYSVDELLEILRRMAAQEQFNLPKKLDELVVPWIEASASAADWSNARAMRSLLERMREAQASRVASDSDADLSAITAADVTRALLVGQPTPAEDVSLELALDKLDRMVGLAPVKAEVATLMARLQLEKRRKDQGLAVSSVSMHMIFTGPPGVGKTEVAQLVGQIFRALGVLKKGHIVNVDREQLVAGYLGQTAIKTMAKCREALDGILFIDEAYALVENTNDGINLGKEAIETLLKFMEDNRDRLIVIAAGYPKQMEEFVRVNPGLKARFSKTIEFPSYSSHELVEILRRMAAIQQFGLPQDIGQLITPWIDSQSNASDWGNARSMRSLLERMREAQAARAAGDSDVDLSAITAADVARALLVGQPVPAEQVSLELALDKLDRMVGLAPVKAEVATLMARLQLEKRRKDQGLPVSSVSMHMIFTGPPGVGKTEVAQLVGQIFSALGVLTKGHIVNVDREGLVAGFTGQTAIKTMEKCREALDGVLFIDEAYALAERVGHGADFGKEAIETLLKFMEDNRDRLIVIAAGYPQEMDRFIQVNPGLKARFSKTIEFPSYSSKELVEILHRMAASQHFTLPPDIGALVSPWIESQSRTKDWGNARSMRTLLERMREAQATRAASDPDADLSAIAPADVTHAIRR